MPYATTKDSVKLYYEEAGSGRRSSSRTSLPATIATGSRRCGTSRGGTLHHLFGARLRAIRRAERLEGLHLQALGGDPWPCSIISRSTRPIGRAVDGRLHRGGAWLHLSRRALSLTIAGGGSGSERALVEEFRKTSKQVAEDFPQEGHAEVAKAYGLNPRASRSWSRTRAASRRSTRCSPSTTPGLKQHSARLSGRAALALRLRSRARKVTVPTLIVVGDEDEPCVEPSFLLKQWIRPPAWWCFPRPATW